MAPTEKFDHIILGGGKGGKSLAMALAGAGHKVALIERGQIGGTCINQACIPTKTMVASAKLIDQAKHAASFGVKLQPAEPSLDAVIARKRRIVKGMVDTHMHLFTNTPNMEFVLGTGQFTSPHEIEVTLQDNSTRHFTSDRIYINTGSKTTIPALEGLDQVPYLTSRTVMELETLPSHLVILGGGYIALEFAQIFARLGSKVTVLIRGRFLPREDEDIAEAIAEILREDGIEFKKAAISNVAKSSDGGLSINLESETLHASHLLLAIGRSPNTAELNLQAAGVETDTNGHIKVDESLRTNVNGIWAIGDCNGGPLFTHVSWDDYRILKANVLHNAGRTTKDRLVPYTLFIDPELGRVGLTEQEARKQGLDIIVAKVPANKIPRANTAGETKGLLKAVIDKNTKQILGCSLLCHSAGEVMSVVQMAMLGKLPYTTVRDTIFTHPTMAESLNILLATIYPCKTIACYRASQFYQDTRLASVRMISAQWRQEMEVQAKATLAIAAAAAEIFDVLIDPAHHKNILPPAFHNYRSENAENSIVTFQLKSGFINRKYRVRVEVIEPNRLIHETEIATGIITKFILEPLENSAFTRVTFSTTWNAEPGISGFIERTLGRKFLEGLYAEEQQKLANYMADLKKRKAAV